MGNKEEYRREFMETTSRFGIRIAQTECIEDVLAEAIEQEVVDERLDILREELMLLHLRALDSGLRWRDFAASAE